MTSGQQSIQINGGAKLYFNNGNNTSGGYITQSAASGEGSHLTISSATTTLTGGTINVEGATTVKDTLTVEGKVTISDTTASSGYTTGALVVSGGLGVGSDMYVDGDIYSNYVRLVQDFSAHKYVSSTSSSIYLGYSSLKASSTGSSIVSFSNTTTSGYARTYKATIVPASGSAGTATIGGSTQSSTFNFSMIEMFIYPARASTNNGSPNTAYIIRIYPNGTGGNTSSYTSIANIFEFRQVIGNTTSTSTYYIKMNTAYEIFLSCFSDPRSSSW